MLKVLDKEKTHVIVKMDIITYDRIKKNNQPDLEKLSIEAMNSKWYDSVDDLFIDLEN